MGVIMLERLEKHGEMRTIQRGDLNAGIETRRGGTFRYEASANTVDFSSATKR